MSFFHWPPPWWPWQPKPVPVPPPPPPPPVPPSDIVQQLLDAHNAQRQLHGLKSLSINTKLEAMAQGHAAAMASKNLMSHDYAGDGSFSSRIIKSGYDYYDCGENIAWNQLTVEQVMAAWLGSLPHRANIFGNFTEVGLAVGYSSNQEPYWCVDFGSPSREAKLPELSNIGAPCGGIESYVKAEFGYLITCR